jgi:hypothetical protein
MKPELLSSAARDQLNLVLSFFGRVDARASVLFAVDTGMTGYLAGRMPPIKSVPVWQFCFPALAIGLIAFSLTHLYAIAFPNLEGGDRSLVFFVEVAKRTEAKFIDEFMEQSEVDHAKDLLGQAWRNAQILTAKFRNLKRAFIFMAISLVPWTISLAIFAARTANVQVGK